MLLKRPKFQTNAKPSGMHEMLPYGSKRRLLSDGELRFYREGLVPALGKRYGVMCKVRLTDVLDVPTHLWRSPAGRKVQQRHVDFVLINKKTTAIVAVVELDDKTHLTEEQQAKDAYLGDALFAAGVPLLRVPIYRRYNPTKLRILLLGALKRHPLTERRLARQKAAPTLRRLFSGLGRDAQASHPRRR